MATAGSGVGKRLTEEMVLTKMKQSSVDRVKNVNLWGSSLSDVSVLSRFPRLEKVSLSVNKISSLQDFRGCTGLTELYLRKNEIRDLTTVGFLKDLPRLRILWLCDNPCAENEMYRQFVIRLLPRLEKLDMHDVTDEERRAALDNNAAAFIMLLHATDEILESASKLDGERSAAAELKETEASTTHPDTLRASRSLSAGGNIYSAITLLLRDMDDEAVDDVRAHCVRLLEARKMGRR